MTLDITGVLYSSTIDTFKNYSTAQTTISVPSTSYTAGETKIYTSTVTMDSTDALVQLIQNYSFSSSKHYLGTHAVLFGADSVDTNFQIVCQSNINATTLTITMYITNTDGSSHSVPSFTGTYSVKRFTDSFE